MASLRTADCPHAYMRDRAGEPCIFCGAPRPRAVVFSPQQGIDGWRRFLREIGLDRAIEVRVSERLPYRTDSDPGDED